MQKEIRRPSPSHVPAEPFVRRIEEFLQHKLKDFAGDLGAHASACIARETGQIHPTSLLISRVFPDLSQEAGRRNLHALIGREKAWIHFDLADAILVYVEGPMAWFSDPELAEIYQEVNLLAIDVTNPTCERGFEMARQKVRQAYERLGSKQQVYKALGVAQHQIDVLTADMRVSA